MRLFFAAWPPAETARALAKWASAFEGRATPAGKIHLTLAFLGDTDPERAIAAARAVRGERHVLPIDIAKYWRDSRVLWVGPREMPAQLKALVSELHSQLRGAGFRLDERPFAAHVTVMRNPRPPRSFPELPEVAWPMTEFTLVRSSLSSKGSQYEVMERFALR